MPSLGELFEAAVGARAAIAWRPSTGEAWIVAETPARPAAPCPRDVPPGDDPAGPSRPGDGK